MDRRVFLGGTLAACLPAPLLAQRRHHPGWTETRGGEGGATLRVTTLAASGPGSLRAAIEAQGPRTIVFDVGGVIDLAGVELRVVEPFLTIAGESAPRGITLIRGGMSIRSHDVIVRHLAIRPGASGQARGWEPDGLTTYRARDVIVDQCSFTWAVDENLSASGPRFEGATVEEWRANTSHRITFSNNIIAESLSNATHSKGEHSKGTLIHDNCTGVLLWRNLYAHNMERHPLAKGGSHCAVVNNVFVNPGRTCAQYTLVEREWSGHAPVTGRMALVGNIMRAGVDTQAGSAMLRFGGVGDLDLFEDDNRAWARDGSPLSIIGYYDARPDGMPAGAGEAAGAQGVIRRVDRQRLWPDGLGAIRSNEVEARVYAACGARPWARDAIDARIVAEARQNTGRIIDSESHVGGYPQI